MNTHTKLIIRFWALLTLIYIFVGCSNQSTDNGYNSVSILFVGNSHIRTGNVPSQLQALARLHGIEITYVDVSENGVNLDGTMRDNAMREMQNGNFDYVVMQARGRSSINDMDLFLNDIQLFSQQIRDSGATPVLYSPAWANINGQPNEELQAFLTDAHKQAAYENNIILINAGDAWVYAYRTIQGLSLYARDGLHANHEGAFLTASVFMATLFDLQIENIPAGNAIDNVPMLNILTVLGFVSIVIFTIYRFAKKQPLHMKKTITAMISLALLQVMSFFPHVFRFTESGNRFIFLYAISFGLLTLAFYSVYCIIRIVFIEKQSLSIVKKYVFYAVSCCVIYGLTFIPVLELRNSLYMGDNAIALAQVVLSFFSSV
ncbi:MAG: SGNH/GDSL hydrolase family protein [Defluviitaleaceae bacterium]|nr:SGNH/GDSL hydrolase family protein [Defluviitaleaceae bacterium]